MVSIVCTGCRKNFELKESEYNRRMRNSQYKILFCSRSCQQGWHGNHHWNDHKLMEKVHDLDEDTINSGTGPIPE